MKHPKKKYLFQADKVVFKSDQPIDPIQIKQVDRRDKRALKENKNRRPLIKTTEDFFLTGFFYNYNGEYTIVPMPDLTLVYFDHAYQMNRIRKEKEIELFSKLNSEEKVTEDVSNELYYYYGHASSCIISLLTSIESFINHSIPEDKPYIKELNNKTELYTKEQIQEGIDFKEKVKFVIPYYFDGKNFFKKSTPTNQLLWNLKELRDDIIHTKAERNFELQEKLFKRVLGFKYDKAIDAVAKFLNFYRPGYIEECDCGLDF